MLSLKSVLEDWDKQAAVLANTLFFLISPYSPIFNPSKQFFSMQLIGCVFSTSQLWWLAQNTFPD